MELDRLYSIYLYNSVEDYTRINIFYLFENEIIGMLKELRNKNSHLYKQYNGIYKYYIVVNKNTPKTIQEIIKGSKHELL